jgi:hypothetical protein
LFSFIDSSIRVTIHSEDNCTHSWVRGPGLRSVKQGDSLLDDLPWCLSDIRPVNFLDSLSRDNQTPPDKLSIHLTKALLVMYLSINLKILITSHGQE